MSGFQPGPGDVETASMYPAGFSGLTYSTWISGAATRLAQGIVSQVRKTGAAGMPATWPYGTPTASMVGSDGWVDPMLWGQITEYVKSDAAAGDRDFAAFAGAQRPAPGPNEFSPSAETMAAQLNADKFGLSVRQQQFAEAKFAIEMANSQAGRRVSSSGSGSYSSGGGGGGGGGGSSGADYAGRLAYQQQSNAQDLAFAAQKQQLELEYLKQKYAMANDPNNPDYAIKREEMALQRELANQNIAYQTQRDQRQEQLARAETTAKLGANPGDAVQREIFLRTGKEPVGTPQSVWTGQPTGGAPTTLSQLMTQLTGAGVFGRPPALPAGTPTTVPYNTDPMNQPPPPAAPTGPPPPAFAFGTQRPRSEITPDGWTRAQEFISGDPQVPSRPNPEHVQLRVVNGEPQAKVTPLSAPPPPRANAQAFTHANSNARFMRPSPPKYATGTSSAWYDPNGEAYVGTSSATQSDINQAQSYYAQQAAMGTPQATFYGMSPTQTITNPLSYQYGMTVEAAKAQNAAPLNNNAVSYDRSGAAHPVYDTTMMTQAEQDAYNIGALTPDRNASGLTQSLYPSMRNYVPPGDMPAPPSTPADPRITAQAGDNVQRDLSAAPVAPPAPQQPPQQAYWGTQALNPGLQTITNSPFVPYASIGNPANVQIMDTATGQYRALRPGEDVPAGATVGVLNPVGTTGTGGAPSGATGAPGAATTPPAPRSTVGANGSTTVYKGVSLPAPSFAAPDSYGNSRVTSPGYVTTPDGGGYYYLLGDGSEVKRPDGSYIYYNPTIKSYVPVTASPTIISSMAQFYKLPPNIQQDILQGKPTGYMLNDKGIDTHIASQMIEQQRSRLAKERGISPAQVPAQLLEMFANQFFSGLEPGRIYPGGWVSSMMAPQFPTSRMLSQEEFRALPVADQRALIEGRAGPRYANNTASQGVYNPGSQNVSAATGPMGGMPTGLFTLPQGQADGRAFNYGQYVQNEADARRIFPEYFQPPSEPQQPWYASPFVKLKTGQDGQVYGKQFDNWVNVATNEITPWTTIPGGYDGPTPKPIPSEEEFNRMLGQQGNDTVTPTPGAYQAYVGMYKAQYPGVFGPITPATPAAPAATPATPATPAATPSTNKNQPPGPPAPGMKWVWVPG